MGRFGTELNHELMSSGEESSKLRPSAGAVRMRNRSEGERGKTGGCCACGLRMTWKVAKDNGGMSPLGGFTRNLWGDEVWTLKATGAVAVTDLRLTVALHLLPSEKSMRIS